jgi:hypothetical protein
MHHPNDVPPSNDSATPDLERVAAALRGQDTFNRAQLAWLMAAAQRWGYDVGYEDGRRDEIALANIAASYAYDGSSFDARVTERGNRQRALRQEADAAAGLPRPGDYRPVEHGESQVAA